MKYLKKYLRPTIIRPHSALRPNTVVIADEPPMAGLLDESYEDTQSGFALEIFP